MRIIMRDGDLTDAIMQYLAINMPTMLYTKDIEIDFGDLEEIVIDMKPKGECPEPDVGDDERPEPASEATEGQVRAANPEATPRRRRRTKAEMEAAAAAEAAEKAAEEEAENQMVGAEAPFDASDEGTEDASWVGDERAEPPEDGEVLLTEEAEVPLVTEEAKAHLEGTDRVVQKSNSNSLFATASNKAPVPDEAPAPEPSTGTRSLFSNLTKPVNTPKE